MNYIKARHRIIFKNKINKCSMEHLVLSLYDDVVNESHNETRFDHKAHIPVIET